MGKNAGDDVSWVGTAITRTVLMQAAGRVDGHGGGADPIGEAGRELGRRWARSLRDLGARIGIITETRLYGKHRHKAVIKGMG